MVDAARRMQTATQEAMATPLEDFDVGHPALFQADAIWPYFARLRREAPVHHSRGSLYGPYWSITKYRDVLEIEADPAIFSSAVKYGGMTLKDTREGFRLPMFIAMDPPKHDAQRAAVAPIVGARQPRRLEVLIRSWAAAILDELPVGETFDWVDRVSIELTTPDAGDPVRFPAAPTAASSTRWSDMATGDPASGKIEHEASARPSCCEMREDFTDLWNERVNAPPRRRPDFHDGACGCDAPPCRRWNISAT